MAEQVTIQGQELYEKVAREFARKLVASLGKEIEAIILYGSVARGEAYQESDIDILVVGNNVHQHEDEISGIRTDVDLEYGTLTTLFYVTPVEIKELIAKGSTFIPEVLKEGVILYGEGKLERTYPEAVGAVR